MSPERAEKVVELRRARHGRHPRWRAAFAGLDARLLGLERHIAGIDREYRRFPVPARMRVAVLWSVLLHLTIIFGVTFKPASPSIVPPQPQLEVVLVNATTPSKPDKADALAQRDLDGGGNTEAARRAKSPLPVPERPGQAVEVQAAAAPPPPAVREPPVRAELEARVQRLEQLEREARQLLAREAATARVEPPARTPQPSVAPGPAPAAAPAAIIAPPAPAPAPAAITAPPAPAPMPAPADSAGVPSATDILQSSVDIARLEARITREWDAYQQRPRRRFVGARTQEFRFARYVEDWRHKIERVGELNYPQAARDHGVYGSLVVTVSIRADGTLERFEINRPSGQKVLDDAARRIVDLAAPFAPFPPEIAKDTDVLSITRTWTFTRADRLVSD